jgi:hypothetical protein
MYLCIYIHESPYLYHVTSTYIHLCIKLYVFVCVSVPTYSLCTYTYPTTTDASLRSWRDVRPPLVRDTCQTTCRIVELHLWTFPHHHPHETHQRHRSRFVRFTVSYRSHTPDRHMCTVRYRETTSIETDYIKLGNDPTTHSTFAEVMDSTPWVSVFSSHPRWWHKPHEVTV